MINFIFKFFFVLKVIIFFIFARFLYDKYNKSEIKPFFSFDKNLLGGPVVRTRRLKQEFGNYVYNFNVIYAQSYWSSLELELLYKLKKKINIPIIFNQNGWYYDGWYTGNSEKKNKLLIKIQKISDLVIYQSNFCKNASKQLNNFIAKNNIVLHNGVPQYYLSNKKKLNKNINIFVIGYFNESTNFRKKNDNISHIFNPAVEALYEIAIKKNKKNIFLNFIGINNNYFKFTKNKIIKNKFNELYKYGFIKFNKTYKTKGEYLEILKKIDISLHLKYKDPCPNAVLERLSFGIPHIYSNSGGTPELINDGGIGINVDDVWDTQLSVNTKILEQNIFKIIENYENYSSNAYMQSKKFTWEAYINDHKKIFNKL